MPNVQTNRFVVLESGGYDQIIKDWITVLRSNNFQVPSDSYLQKLNRYVLSNKTNILLRDREWILAQEAGCQNAARVSLINPTSAKLTEVNSPTWTALQGYTGNGTNMQLRTGFLPVTHGVMYSQNDGSISIYGRKVVAQAGKIPFGSFEASVSQCMLALNFTGNGKLYAINSTGQSIQANTDTQGLFSSMRTASNAQSVSKNGAILGTDVTMSSVTMNAKELYALCWNNGTSAGNFDTNELSRITIGKGSGMDRVLDYNNFQAFMTELGTQV